MYGRDNIQRMAAKQGEYRRAMDHLDAAPYASRADMSDLFDAALKAMQTGDGTASTTAARAYLVAKGNATETAAKRDQGIERRWRQSMAWSALATWWASAFQELHAAEASFMAMEGAFIDRR